jgi:threonine aldolase
MVFLQIPQEHCAPLEHHLRQHGILMQALYGTRLVTHLDIAEADVEIVVKAAKGYFAGI